MKEHGNLTKNSAGKNEIVKNDFSTTHPQSYKTEPLSAISSSSLYIIVWMRGLNNLKAISKETGS